MSQTQKAQSFAEYQGELLIGIAAEMPSGTSLVQREGSPILDIMGKGVLGQLLITEEGTLNITYSALSLSPVLQRKFASLVGNLRPRWDRVTVGAAPDAVQPIQHVLNLDQHERPNIQHVAYSVGEVASFWLLIEQLFAD